jgi:replicative DNA helicase
VKPTKYSQVSVQALLRKLNPRAVYTALGIDSGHIQDSDDAYRTQCPFHPEASNYSLVTDKDTRATYCLDLSCRASRLNEGGGNILEFYAMAKNIPYDTAVEEWAERLNLSLEDRGEDDVDVDRDISYFKYVEVGRYLHEEGDEGEDKGLKPLPLVVEGEEVFGRGVIVPQSQVAELSRQYTSDLYRSQFIYELTDKEAVDTERRRNALFLLGNYFIVFEAKTSAEIVHAINQAIELVERLNKDFDIPFEAINIYYSHKVIEVEVDYTVFGITPRPDLDRIFAEMTRILVASEGSSNGEPGPTAFTQIRKDTYTYDYMTAVPGTKISLPGRDIFKIRLPYNLFKKTSYQRLHELSRRKPDLGERQMVDRMSPAGRAFFERAARAVEGEGRSDEHETIATLFYRDTETPELLTTANQLARTLLKRLFSENRLILRTPSEHFNRALGGGFHPGNLYMVAGFPGSGTTTFSMWLLTRIAEAYRIPCVFVSLQVGIEELFKRTLAMLGGIDLGEISQKRQQPSELYSDSAFHRRTFAAYEKFVEIADNITIVEGTRVASIDHLRKLASDLKHKTVEANGQSNVLVVIDSLQLLLAHMRVAREAEGGYNLDMLTSMLKTMARELDITIYATTEYYAEHNSFYAGVDPANTDLKELYQSTQFADTVSILSNQGTRLHNLIDYYRSTLAGTHQEQETGKLVKRLQGIEDEMRESEACKAMQSAFCVLDIIKNRGGMTNKILFIHNRATASFEPVEYFESLDTI